MNYETSNDFELNKRLAELLGETISETQYNQNAVVVISDGYDTLDYCNSWADMGPVIKDLGIDIVSPDSNGSKDLQCVKFYPNFQPDIHSFDPNQLRAAVIVAIQVLEGRE